MLIAAAFVPATPLLVPQVASGASDELADLREHSIDAVAGVLSSGATEVVLVGLAPRTGAYPGDAVRSFAGFGVSDPTEAPPARPLALPAALSVGQWLLDQAREQLNNGDRDHASTLAVQPFGVTAHDSADRCADLGRVLAQRTAGVAVVVVGDGSACRSPKAPGALDDRAHAFDDAWLKALVDVDLEALFALDAALAGELKVEGRAPWQVAAGMAESTLDEASDVAPWRGELMASVDPYGVMYGVATWVRHAADDAAPS